MDNIKLKALFAQNTDSQEAEKMAAYMRGKFTFFGIPTPKRKRLTKQFFATVQKTDSINWNFIFDCYAADEREFQYAVMDYLQENKKLLSAADVPNLKRLVETKSWWDTIDGLDKIIGSIALNDKTVNHTLLEWSIDNNFWLRRIAIDHQLGRKDKTDTVLLAEIIKNNFGQSEFFINKAIGWALREYSKTNPDWVQNFIAENKDKMAKLSIKEASKYI